MKKKEGEEEMRKEDAVTTKEVLQRRTETGKEKKETNGERGEEVMTIEMTKKDAVKTKEVLKEEDGDSCGEGDERG